MVKAALALVPPELRERIRDLKKLLRTHGVWKEDVALNDVINMALF